MQLFHDDVILHHGPATYAMSNFEFLERSSRPAAILARQVLQSWFSYYPEVEQGRLMSRFCLADDVQHQSAFFELLLHELLRRYCMKVEIEPQLENREEKPDFHVLLPSGRWLYVEAKVVIDSVQKDGGTSLMRRTLDALNKIHSAYFFVDVELEGTPWSEPSSKEIARTVERWLEELNVEAVKADFAAGHYAAYELRIPCQGATLIINPIPKSESEPTDRLVGSPPTMAGWLATSSKLSKAITKKAYKYGMLEDPLILALNIFGFGTTRGDVVDALLGSKEYLFDWSGAEAELLSVRRKGGTWMQGRSPKGTRLSAIMWTAELTPWSVGSRTLELLRHPSASPAMPELPFSLPEHQLDQELQHTIPGSTLSDLLGLPQGWPVNILSN